MTPGDQPFPRIARAVGRRDHGRGHPFVCRRHHGGEQGLLAGVVVVDGAAGDSGVRSYRRERDVRIAVSGEQR